MTPHARLAPLASLVVLAAGSLAGPLAAQGPAFESPGLSKYSTLGQTTRFSREFNPALGFVVDGYFDAIDDDLDDGTDFSLRLLEFNGSAYVDPKAWAYVVISSEELEGVEVEEAAVEYIGFESNATIKAGRFFVDFGKQMQNHLEELRTLERPLVFREYLGEELAGTGVQYDTWFPLNDTTPVRFSLGAFGELLAGEHHGDEEEEPEAEASVPDRKDLDELSFTARVTGMTDVGEASLFQLGASARYVPEFTFAFDDGTNAFEVDGNDNLVYGVDLTYGWSDETGVRSLTAGGEWLAADGALSAELDDPAAPTALLVTDDSATGFYAFADYGWSVQDSAGVQFSWIEELENTRNDASEVDVYWTHHFTEFRRLRLGYTFGDSDVEQEFHRVYLQFTAFFGSHSHGLNW